MEDMIMQVPWHCGERSCPVGWHLGSYWITGSAETGYSYDPYTDGDHEDVDEEDLPSFEDQDKMWRSYWKDVVETGRDPLGQLPIKDFRVVTRRWQVEVRNQFGRLILIHARLRGRGRWKKPDKLPHELMDYLLVEKPESSYLLMGHKALNALIDDINKDERCRLQRSTSKLPLVKFMVEIDERIPRSKTVVSREVKAAAKRALKKLKE